MSEFVTRRFRSSKQLPEFDLKAQQNYPEDNVQSSEGSVIGVEVKGKEVRAKRLLNGSVSRCHHPNYARVQHTNIVSIIHLGLQLNFNFSLILAFSWMEAADRSTCLHIPFLSTDLELATVHFLRMKTRPFPYSATSPLHTATGKISECGWTLNAVSSVFCKMYTHLLIQALVVSNFLSIILVLLSANASRNRLPPMAQRSMFRAVHVMEIPFILVGYLTLILGRNFWPNQNKFWLSYRKAVLPADIKACQSDVNIPC